MQSVCSSIIGLIQNANVSLYKLASYNQKDKLLKYASLEQNLRRLLDNLSFEKIIHNHPAILTKMIWLLWILRSLEDNWEDRFYALIQE